MSRAQRYGPPLLALAAFALGLFLRYYRLGEVPPRLWYDEAWLVNRARDMLATHQFPVYFPTPGGGVHPMLVYLTALSVTLFGLSPISSRIATAFAGSLAVPLLYLAAKDLLAEFTGKERARWLAVLAAFLQAGLFWNIMLSRLGTEVILVPLFAIPALHLFYLGLRKETGSDTSRLPIHHSPFIIHRSPYIASGLLLGLALYTSPNARFLPITFLLIAVTLIALNLREWRKPMVALMIVGLAAVLIFAPFGIYILRHPEALFGRAFTVTYETFGPGADNVPLAVLRNLANTIWGISVHGDTFSRHNLPGRPNLDPLLSIFFWLGLVVALLRARRFSALVLIIGWFVGMTLPTVLSDGAPIFTRSLAAAPAMILLIVIGLSATHDWLSRVLSPAPPLPSEASSPASSLLRPSFPRSVPASFFLLISASLTFNIYDYFIRFADDPSTFDGFTVGEYQTAETARELSQTDAVYLTPWTAVNDFPNYELLLKDTTARGFDSSLCLPFQPGRTNDYLVNVLADPSGLDRLSARFPQGAVTKTILHQPEPFPLTEVFTVPAEVESPLFHLDEIQFGEDISLVGSELTSNRLSPGDTLTVTLVWKALHPVNADLVAFIHLAPDADSPPSAQDDSAPCRATYQTYLWREGEVVFDSHPLAIPADLPAGRYFLFVGMYSWPDQTPVPITSAGGESARLPIGQIEVAP